MKLYELQLGTKIYSSDGDTFAITKKEVRTSDVVYIDAEMYIENLTQIRVVGFPAFLKVEPYKDGYRIT